jgi:hypothetical protein
MFDVRGRLKQAESGHLSAGFRGVDISRNDYGKGGTGCGVGL